MKVRLTQRLIGTFPNPEREIFLWDETFPGFGLRVQPSGAKAYQLQYRDHKGKSYRITLGRHPVLGPDEARELARKRMAATLLAESPAAETKAPRTETTLAELADRYLREHAEIYKKNRSVHEDGRLLTKVILPKLGAKPVAGITRSDLAAFHAALASTPIQANRALALLSKMFNLAEVWELRSDGTNPCRHLRKFPERGRRRYLSGQELVRLGAALAAAQAEGSESFDTILALRLILLTGARHHEVVSLRWTEVNLERGTLTLTDSKTGQRDIVLAAPAIQLLKEASERSQGPWLFPGRNPAKHRQSLTAAWARLRATVGITDVHIHDLRHTYASTAVGLGLGLPVLAGLLGHTQLATTQRYAHLDLDPRREAAEAIAGQLDQLLRGHERSLDKPISGALPESPLR
jgi:integrase